MLASGVSVLVKVELTDMTSLPLPADDGGLPLRDGEVVLLVPPSLELFDPGEAD